MVEDIDEAVVGEAVDSDEEAVCGGMWEAVVVGDAVDRRAVGGKSGALEFDIELNWRCNGL